MAQKQVKGVGGVIQGLITSREREHHATQETNAVISPVEQTDAQEPEPGQGGDAHGSGHEREGGSGRSSSPPAPSSQKTKEKKQEARRGRPPKGTRPSLPVEREKVSLRLRADLVAHYRDWSWAERCQFSDLVDRALEHYQRANRGKNDRKPETE